VAYDISFLGHTLAIEFGIQLGIQIRQGTGKPTIAASFTMLLVILILFTFTNSLLWIMAICMLKELLYRFRFSWEKFHTLFITWYSKYV